MRTSQLRKYYVSFNTMDEAVAIFERFAQLKWNYKNGTLNDARYIIESTPVDKITCHDDFVMTSKDKDNVIDTATFLSITSNQTPTMSPTVQSAQAPRNSALNIVNELKAKKLFENEKAVQKIADLIETVDTTATNFEAAFRKAQDKMNKLHAVNCALAHAVEYRDVLEIERLQKIINESLTFVTKTNDIIAALESTGAAIVKADKKNAKGVTGADYMGE